MPLSVNVGLSRKASRDFQSSGVSINVTAELDQALLARPQDLQHQVNELYAQAEEALARQADRMAEADRGPAPPRSDRQPYPTRERPQAAGHNGNGSNGSRMTASQRRAIHAIARRAGADPAYEARQIIGRNMDDLSVRQASDLIDHLQTLSPLAPAPNGR